jgi:hypothetical protein
MFVPYVIATSLMIIATANTLHAGDLFQGTRLAPVDAARSLEDAVGPTYSRIVFNLGFLAMVLSTITLQMLAAGFACTVMFGWKVGSFKYRIATLLPTPGVLGAVYWSNIGIWVAVPIALLCGFLLPIAYIGFIILQRRRAYLGNDMPTGFKGTAWLGGMVLATAILIVFLGWYALTKGPQYLEAFR